MARQLWDVIQALNAQHKDRWFIVGSYAAWLYMVTSKTRPQFSQDEWKLVAPGDIDIAISYSDASEPTVTVDHVVATKVGLDLPHSAYKSLELCGEVATMNEVEFVYNDASNDLHGSAFLLANILRLVPVDILISRLDQGSARGDGKDRARLKRAAGLRSAFGMPPKQQQGSLFADIANFRFNKK